MNNFVALIRDTLQSKNPEGTWKWARNILLTKGLKSIANENGIKFQYLVRGTVIGFIATNRDVVYFHKNEEGIDEIGVVNTNNDVPIYRTIVKTNLLNFQLNCPIEGIFVYNFKGELIVSWCDGVYDNSNPPRVLNTSTLPFEVNPDGTLVNPDNFFLINLSPNIFQGDLNVSYLNFGVFGGFVAYITFSYVNNDDSLAGYFPVSDIGYIGARANPVEGKGLRLEFTNLDTNFTRLQIGLVIRTESEENVAANLVGYEGQIIDYVGNSLTINITSLDNFTAGSAEAILIEQAFFSKVNTMTKYENQAVIGNVELSNNDAFKFQKYANLIEIVPFEYYTDADTVSSRSDAEQDASFMPDEVYAIYIQLQLLNGSYTSAYHIPGRSAEGNETDPLDEQTKIDFDLGWVDDEDSIKNFHIFNNGFAQAVNNPTVAVPNPPIPDESNNKFGYWENIETYPNDDEYNSIVDYDGNNLSAVDLRNTPIRYHRFPSIHSMREQSVAGLPRRINPDATYEFSRHRKLGIKITNIDDIIPQEIKDQIQGYRICHVERNSSNSYVAGNWIATRRKDVDDGKTLVDDDGFFEHYDFGYYPLDDNDIEFQRVRVLGNELFKFRPSLSPLYVQNNYSYIVDNEFVISGSAVGTPSDLNRYSKCFTPLIYRPANSFADNTEYHEEGINLDLKENFVAKQIEEVDPGPYAGDIFRPYPVVQYVVLNITAYNHKLNVYAGFVSDNLNIVGRTSNFNNNIRFKKADAFNTSRQNVNLRSRIRIINPNYTNGAPTYVQIRRSLKIIITGLHAPLNFTELFNEDPVDRDAEDIAILENFDYDFDVLGAESLSSIQNILTIFTFDIDSDFINRFPYRIYRGLKIPNETLSIDAISTFLLDDYYEMPNDKGEIIALRGREGVLFIQHRFALFAASIKDKLKTDGVDAFLGRSDLFTRPPEELLPDDKGYIGSVSKFACVIFKGMYITVNQANGQIFIIKGGTVIEASDKGNKNWFWNNWDNGLTYFWEDDNGEKRRIDNPFISVGHLVAYDKEFNRLLFTKKLYEYKFPERIGEDVNVDTTNFDGEFYSINGVKLNFNDTENFNNLSKTLSYNLEPGKESWICEHDYYPNLVYYTNAGLFSAINNIVGENRCSVYEHNDILTKGLYYGNKFDSYVDLIFNQRLDVSKLLKSIMWITDVVDAQGGYKTDKTITHIMVYNNHQCSGIINLKDNHFEVTRNIKGEWNFNTFRDLVINPNNPIIDENGEVIISNLNNLKLWFDKSNFIGKFITIRLIIDNVDNEDVYIHEVKTTSLLSKR